MSKIASLLSQHDSIETPSDKPGAIHCWDNAPTERFFGSLKREWLDGNRYAVREDAIRDAREYITYYNSRRLHTAIGDKTPIEFEAQQLAKCT